MGQEQHKIFFRTGRKKRLCFIIVMEITAFLGVIGSYCKNHWWAGAVLNFEHERVCLYFYFDVVADTLSASFNYVLRGKGV